MSTLNKIKDGILQGVGFIAVLSITGLAYASYTWVSQSTVTTGDTLTASAWNDMINNQNYLKQEVEARLQNSGGSMSGNLDMSTNKVTNLGTPTASSDAATKAYADSVGASGGSSVALCETRTIYNGNLGGFAGADAKCVSECGAGFKFATLGDIGNFPGAIWFRAWINRTDTGANCSGRTSSNSGYYGTYITTSSGLWSNSNHHCANSNSLVCVRY